MKKRYFYSDPLAAAWMVKHHGMTLYIGHLPDDYDAYSAVNWWHAIDDERFRREKFHQNDIRFYIHPDSLHLLEPQAGDILLVGLSDEEPEYLLVKENVVGSLYAVSGSERYYVASTNRFIQRKGIPFIWPETAPSESPQPNPGE